MNLTVKIFADGADLTHIKELSSNALIAGFTTNPTLMRQAGVKDYEIFARSMLEIVGDKPVSFEVFSDDFQDMERQAVLISSWGPNVFVKIPVTNTKKESSIPLVRRLSDRGVKVNVTALFTENQIEESVKATSAGPGANISVFAGRIADAGKDPSPYIKYAVDFCSDFSQIEVIWASPREVLNVVQAHDLGCHIITVTPEILKKLSSLGKDLDDFSLDTVKMFFNDAQSAGFSL